MYNKLIVLFVLVLIACSGVNAQSYENLTVTKFEKGISGKRYQLVDVRTPKEYALGHLEAASLADWKDSTVFVAQIGVLDKSRPVYIYCRSGNRSSKAASWLIEHGFKKVYNLQDGIIGWEQSGRKIVKADDK